ncbi:hypothetical protein [Barrientosiimonas humi]|uniref:hypothetical protein n=1 Tax=Barrientosiimonas humi TaxID=999931 RepID=UPI00370DB6D7
MSWFEGCELLERAERMKRDAVEALLRDGASTKSVAQMLEVPSAEVARLRKIADEDSGSPAESAAVVQEPEGRSGAA